MSKAYDSEARRTGDDTSSRRVRPVEGAAIAAVRIWLPGGNRMESIPGQAVISGRMLAEGTANRDWRRISEEAESRGCAITTTAGRSVQALALDGLAADWKRILDWAAELTLTPSFPAERCDWVCRQAIAELESLADMPEVVTGWAFLDQLYPDHPLGRPLLGSVEGLETLAREPERCSSFHQRCLARGPLIAVAGAIDPEAVSSHLEDLFGPCADATGSSLELDEPEAASQRTREVALPPGDQAHLWIGAPTVRRSAPEYEAVRVLGVILGSGGGLVGRVPQRVREDEGLAYACHVETVAGAGLDRGRLVIALGTSRARLDRALAAVREELERVRLDGVSPEEVGEAQSYLSGREPFGRETARQWALLDLESRLWRLPVADESWCRGRIEEVSFGDVKEVARRYLDPAQLVVTIGIPS